MHKVNVVVDTDELSVLPVGVQVVPTYTMVTPGSTRVRVMVHNHAKHSVIWKKRFPLAVIEAANLIPEAVHEEQWTKLYAQAVGLVTQEAPKQEQEWPLSEILLEKVDVLTAEQQKQVEALLVEFGDVFSRSDIYDPGKADHVEHDIKVTDKRPFKQCYHMISPHLYEEVRKHIQEMVDVGVIAKSYSPWASPVVLVQKKDKGLRIYLDYRKLNARTVRDSYTLPHMDEILNKLHASRYFSALDLKWGYWQVPLAQAAQEMTAFTVRPLGFYEFLRMPFGLTNAPSTFQQLMETAFNEVHLSWILIYLDDIIIQSSTVDEQIARLRLVFQKLRDTGLKLKPSKCQWFLREVKYLGHIVSADGISTDLEKVAAVAKWPVPTKALDLRSFLGFTSYYQRFIKNYSRIAKPLHMLVADVEAWHMEYEWSEACQEAFDTLKTRCIEAPILAYPNFDKPFIVHTDASGMGLGAMLYQADGDGRERVIAYASRGLSKSEANYPAHKLEFLALKWAVCEKFQDYLLGAHFTVHTDNNPLTYVLTTAKVDAMGQCWLAALSCHNFTIKYHAGKKNIDADALSRIGWVGPGVQDELVVIPPEGVHGMLDPSVQEVPVLETVVTSAAMVADLTQEEDQQQAQLDDKDWVAIQHQDDVLSLVMALLE